MTCLLVCFAPEFSKPHPALTRKCPLLHPLTHCTHRLRALKLCGWGFDKESPSLAYIDRLASDGLYARAAAVAVFTLRMGRAIALLNSGAAAATTTAAAATTTTQRPGADSSGQSVGRSVSALCRRL